MAAVLSRGTVKSDNSCLFTAIARLAENITDEIRLKTAGRKLRGVCADAAAADPDPLTRALLLGHDSIEAYGKWILDDHHWGGEPEIVMLANHFSIEIIVCSCESLSFLRYAPEAADSPGRAYLLYTGQHYDPLLGADGTRVFAADGASLASLDESALDLARLHNVDAAKRASEKRVNRIKCCGCGAILADAAAFQEHCGVIEHDDDFAYDCEQIEIVISGDEELPEGSVDLNAPHVEAFYNALEPEKLSLSMRCAAAPFAHRGVHYPTLEECWRALEGDTTIEERRTQLAEAIDMQYRTDAARSSGLRALLVQTAPKMLVCVDIDPWLGMQAAGGISSGQNGMGKALMRTRDALIAEDAA